MLLHQLDRFSLDELQFNPFDRKFVLDALIKPLAILLIIQSVPIVMFVQRLREDDFKIQLDILAVRNYLVSPITEELTCR